MEGVKRMSHNQIIQSPQTALQFVDIKCRQSREILRLRPAAFRHPMIHVLHVNDESNNFGGGVI